MNLILWKPDSSIASILNTQLSRLQTVDYTTVTDKVSSLTAILVPLVKTVEEHPPLRKAFVRWLGKKDLTSGDGKLDSQKIAEHLIGTETWQKNFHVLHQQMITVTQKFASQKFDNTIPNHFKDLEVGKLDQKMWKSYHGILSTLTLISKLEKISVDNNEKAWNKEKIILALRTFCLHYLVMVSKSPIFDTEAIQHCPFSEYMSDNSPRYHREDGGEIGLTFLAEIKNKHPWLKKYSPVLIKNQSYFNLILKCCHTFFVDGNCLDYLKITDEISEIDDLMPKCLAPIVFLDISQLVGERVNKLGLTEDPIGEVIQQCSTALSKSNKTTLFGIVLRIDNQEICLFYSKDQNLLKKFRDNFGDFQGNHGAFPEIMRLKTYLLASGFDLKRFIGLYPLEQRRNVEQYLTLESIYTPEFTENDVNETRKDLINFLESISSRDNNNSKLNKFNLFYVNFFLNLIKNLPASLLITDPEACEAVVLRLRKIQKLMSQLSELSFSQQAMNFHLIFQHIQFLLIFFKMDTSETLSELLNQMAPLAPLGVNKETYVTTSGITCLGMIYDALRKIFPPNLSEDKPIAVFGNSCYYQLVESDSGLKNCMNEYFKCEVQSFVKHSTVDNIDKKRIAVLVLDQLPNRVVLPEVAVIEIEKIVKDILKEPRDPNFPLVLIVDCATTLLMHQDIQDLVNNLSEYIQEGQLILIPTNSFIKFMLCGLDAYSGGAIEVFSSKQHKNAEALERHLKVASGEDALSVEASRIFHLVIKYAKEQILEYHQTITSNTHSIYQKFEEHQLTMKEKIDVNSTDKDKKIDWQSPIQVAIRSKEIPMIGLHFNYIYHQIFPKQEINSEKLHIIVLVMQYLLFAKLSKSHLLITIKQSFGFFEPNLIECWEALRFTLGLSEENLQAYATIILEVNDALKKSLSSQQMCSELAEKIEFLANIKNLSKRIGQVHATIMTAKEGFEGILEFFFSKVKQLENQNL